ALLAVDFDGHEVARQRRRHFIARKRLRLHHVAPVAARVSDGEKDRLVFFARSGQRGVAPGLPLHAGERGGDEQRRHPERSEESQDAHGARYFATLSPWTMWYARSAANPLNVSRSPFGHVTVTLAFLSAPRPT